MNAFLPYLKYLRPYRFHFWMAMLAGVVFAVSSGFSLPMMADKVFPRLFGDGQQMDGLTVAVVAMGIPLVFAIRAISGFFNVYLINYCGVRILESIRASFFSKILEVEPGYFTKSRTGDLVSRMSADTALVQLTLTEAANDLIRQPLTLLAAVSFLIYKSASDQQFAFIFLCLLVVPASVFPVRALGKRLFCKAKQQQVEQGDVSNLMTEAVSGAREIRIFRAEASFLERFQRKVADLLHSQMRVIKYFHMLSPSIEVISSAGVSLAFVVAYIQGITLETFMPLLFALYMSYEPIKKIGVLSSRFHRGKAALERLEEITGYPISILEPGADRAISLDRARGEIEFTDVSFAYGEEPTLEGVSFRIQPGEKVAVVGPSGAGKSTLIQLIPRFYDPASGSVRIDGNDVRDLSFEDLRRNIAIVLQEPVLFAGTFEDNIRLGKPEATAEQVEEAARKAHIHDFIVSLPMGYKTEAGERGTQLSGGQRQRIALARAFLKEAPILIMDEATSALDSESEEKIQLALSSLFEHVTGIMIAHRFSSIRLVDRILVLDKGRLVASGTHAELMESCSLYRKLYLNQAGTDDAGYEARSAV